MPVRLAKLFQSHDLMRKVFQGVEFWPHTLVSSSEHTAGEVTHYIRRVPHRRRPEELWVEVEVEERVSSLGRKDCCLQLAFQAEDLDSRLVAEVEGVHTRNLLVLGAVDSAIMN
jgi:hypothetical protein